MDGADGRKSSTTATITFIQNEPVKRCTNVQSSESCADNKLIGDTIAYSVYQAHTHNIHRHIFHAHIKPVAEHNSRTTTNIKTEEAGATKRSPLPKKVSFSGDEDRLHA